VGAVKGNSPEIIFTGVELSRVYFRDEGISPWRWGQISWDYLKNDQTLSLKKRQIFQLKVRNNNKI
jgi:hypothetical protein